MRLGGSDFAGAVRLNLAYFTTAGLSCHPPGSGAREGVEGNTVGELADFLPLPQQCEKQRKEPKLFAKVGQPRKDRKGREEQLCRSRPLHLLCS